jgi:hypothetical protein
MVIEPPATSKQVPVSIKIRAPVDPNFLREGVSLRIFEKLVAVNQGISV